MLHKAFHNKQVCACFETHNVMWQVSLVLIVLLPVILWLILCRQELSNKGICVCWINLRHYLSWTQENRVKGDSDLNNTSSMQFDLVPKQWQSLQWLHFYGFKLYASSMLNCGGFGEKTQVQYMVLGSWRENQSCSTHLFLCFKSLYHQASCWIYYFS